MRVEAFAALVLFAVPGTVAPDAGTRPPFLR
jgi:hypothetical protein